MSKIQVVCVLDRSGSMMGDEDKVIDSFNEFINKQKSANLDVDVSLFLFDDEYETVFKGVPIDSVKPLTRDTYFVRGMTALNDAVGKTVMEFDKSEHVFFFVDTDGFENSSKEFHAAQVREMIEAKTKKGWDFTFVGADLTKEQTAQMGANLGISKTGAFDKSHEGYATRTAFVSNSLSAYAESVNGK